MPEPAPPPDLSVVVPAFNEAARLPASVATALAFLEGSGRSFELVLVDDGSSDSTLEVMRGLAAEREAVRVVALRPNRGKGRAIAEGVAVSRGRLVLVSDADFSTPITELTVLEAALAGGADVAIGSRALRGARVEVSQPAYRVLMGKTFNLLVQAVVLPGLWDTQCGFKLFRGEAARAVFAQLRVEGFGYDVDALFRARRMGFRIVEVPVRWINSPDTRVAAVRHSAEMFADVFRVRFGR